MKLLVDTDVLLDVALDRAPFAEAACRLLDHLQTHPGDGMIAWHSVSNFYYMVRSAQGDRDTRAFIADLLEFLHVVAGNTTSVQTALSLPMSDFEDALQVASAQSGNAGRIVTRNTGDYRQSPLAARSPAEILAEIGVES